MNLTHVTTITLLTGAALLVSDMADAQARGPSRFAPRQAERSAPISVDEASAREAKLAELEAWLGRLVGQYRLQGTVSAYVGGGTGSKTSASLDASGWGQARCIDGQCYLESERQGVGECRNVGSGPGVLCMIDLPWPQFTWDQVMPMGPSQGEVRIGGPNLEGARILYGIDPDNLGIRLLMADGKSLAVEALGFLEGGWMVFTTRCVNHGDDTCKWEFRIRIRGDGRPIEAQFKASDVRRAVPWSKYNITMRRETQIPERQSRASDQPPQALQR